MLNHNLHDLNHWFIKNSNIHGQGLFARKYFNQNEPVGIVFVVTSNSGNPAYDLVRTEFGRYVNHHPEGNIDLEPHRNLIIARANQPIHPQDEITSDYNSGIAKLICGGFPKFLEDDPDSHVILPHHSHFQDPNEADLPFLNILKTFENFKH